MVSSKEKSEDELCRIEKQLREIAAHSSNISSQIRAGDMNSNYYSNLLSQLDHLMKQHEHLTMKHAKVREDIRKLQKYNEEQT